MPPPPPSPLGEAIELMSDGAQAWLDGPVALLREAADRAAAPSYTADVAAADAVGYGARVAKAWFGGLNALADAIAVVGNPPGDAHRFVVDVPPAPVTRQVRIVTRTWRWLLAPEPPGLVVAVWPPAVLRRDATKVRIFATPLVLEPCWDVELELSAADGTSTRVSRSLDATTELKPEDPWPGTGP